MKSSKKKTKPDLLQLNEAHLQLVRDIVHRNLESSVVWAFGSRAQGCAKPHSDLDLAIVSPQIPTALQISKLKLDFEESDLPFRVDVVVWSELDTTFQQIIEQCHVVLWE